MKSLLIATLASLLLPFSAYKDGALKEITKPYLGEYECRSAILGDTDLTAYYKAIILDLGKNNEYTLTVTDLKGKQHTETGKYAYDNKKQTLTFYSDSLASIKREFTLSKGKFHVILPFGKKTACFEFEQK